MFTHEERLVENKFLSRFGNNAEIFKKLLVQYEKLLHKIKTSSNEYNTYCTAILAATNLKGFISTYDRLSKGYLGESEAIFKKVIEAFIAEIYFFEYPDQAKQWVEGKQIRKINNRKMMARALDKIQKEKQIFPTDYEQFFEEYIYGSFYSSSNNISHLDFIFVHKEIGLENDGTSYAQTFVIGPRFDDYYMEISMNRIMLLCLFQLSYLEYSFKIAVDDNSIYEEARSVILGVG